jgi:hypothetical protein
MVRGGARQAPPFFQKAEPARPAIRFFCVQGFLHAVIAGACDSVPRKKSPNRPISPLLGHICGFASGGEYVKEAARDRDRF